MRRSLVIAVAGAAILAGVASRRSVETLKATLEVTEDTLDRVERYIVATLADEPELAA